VAFCRGDASRGREISLTYSGARIGATRRAVACARDDVVCSSAPAARCKRNRRKGQQQHRSRHRTGGCGLSPVTAGMCEPGAVLVEFGTTAAWRPARVDTDERVH
jgi:hypothetical protein